MSSKIPWTLQNLSTPAYLNRAKVDWPLAKTEEKLEEDWGAGTTPALIQYYLSTSSVLTQY